MTHITSPDIVAQLVGEVGEHLSNIYLGKEHPRRTEFVGRLEEMVRAQLKKELFADEHDVPVEDVVFASEALEDSHGTDKPMSPMRVKENVVEGYFRDSHAMSENYDVVINHPNAKGGIVNLNDIQRDEDHVGLVAQDLVGDFPEGVTITAADPSTFEVSFNNLQQRVLDWAETDLKDVNDGSKFIFLIDMLRAMVEDLQTPEDYAETMLYLMQGMNEAGFKMHEDIMPAAYRMIEVIKTRKYYADSHGDLQYTSKG